MSWWKTVVREPLVHFVAIGGLLFAIDAWRTSDAPARSAAPALPTASATEVASPGARTPIIIDADARAQIASQAERRLGRVASAAEIAEETDRWIDEEVLYREALARGLEKNDPVIHQRVAQQMSYVLQQSLIVPEPTDAELRAWFDQHPERWSVAEHIDFTHVFFGGTADGDATRRANEAAAAIANGAPPERLGDRFSGGHRYRGRRIADLALVFGEDFTNGLATQPPGTWVKRTSKHGIHLVRVDRVDAARGPDFAAAKLDVRKEWLEARRAAEVATAMKKLRDSWTIERR